MMEYDLGKEGEKQARTLLKKMGFEVQSPDWLATKDNIWICIEVKKKERFKEVVGLCGVMEIEFAALTLRMIKNLFGVAFFRNNIEKCKEWNEKLQEPLVDIIYG